MTERVCSATPSGRDPFFWLARALLVSLLVPVGVLVPIRSASASECGAALIPGSGWLSGAGVDVVSNGQDGCGGLIELGLGYQCGELAQRLYEERGWGTVGAGGNGGAAFIPEGSPQLEFYANGTVTPAPGDLIVEDATPGNPFGHVAVVDAVAGARIHAVEQNGDAAGRHVYTIVAGRITGGYGEVRGVVHSPFNPVPVGPAHSGRRPTVTTLPTTSLPATTVPTSTAPATQRAPAVLPAPPATAPSSPPSSPAAPAAGPPQQTHSPVAVASDTQGAAPAVGYPVPTGPPASESGPAGPRDAEVADPAVQRGGGSSDSDAVRAVEAAVDSALTRVGGAVASDAWVEEFLDDLSAR